MSGTDRESIERKLAELPLLSYAFLSPGELVFSEKVRAICETCPMFGVSWSCPPAVGTVEDCRRKCLSHTGVLVLATAEDDAKTVLAAAEALGTDTEILGGSACTRCDRCTYPAAPCRFPQAMHPCAESYGILVTALAERLGLGFSESGTAVWYALILFGHDGEKE